MNPDGAFRKNAIIVGVLFIIGTVTGILSKILTGPLPEGRDLLISVSANPAQLVTGALFLLAMGLTLAMVPVMMYPVLKKFSETLALGYLVFRGALETTIAIAMAAVLLLLVPLSRELTKAGTPDAPYIQHLGMLVLWVRDLLDPVLSIVFPLGALMFYYVLFRSRLIPRWLSGWGLIAIIPYIASALFVLYGLIGPMSAIRIIMVLPLAVQEMMMAVWFIAKGFDPAAIAAGSV